MQIKPDHTAITHYGINVEDVNDVVESVIAGKEAGQVYEGEQRFDAYSYILNKRSSKDIETITGFSSFHPTPVRE